jgi:hypothetical protein
MPKAVYAGFVYFGIVFGAGFVLGVVRVLFLVPRLGERWAELAEMPIMGFTIFLAAGYILRLFREVRVPSHALVAGLLALALMLCAELSLVVVIQSQPLVEYLSSRDKISGSVFVAMLLMFAVMPRLRLAIQR